MSGSQPLSQAVFDQLAGLDTPTVSNAIERLDPRPRNEGFVHGTARCVFPDRPPMLGYAATAKVRTSTQPVTGRCYHDHLEFWSYVESLPAPRVIVLQDVDSIPGLGAFFGELHAAIASALQSVGCVTNGAVRDLPAIDARSFQLFAGNLSPSHAYAHIVKPDGPVEIGGLTIRPGDLVHGDRHGLLVIPLAIAADVPVMAGRILDEERELIEFCASPRFSIKALGAVLARIRSKKPT
jgi:4-hydroxy-4-methyl-2-oxoglutarate aldolase